MNIYFSIICVIFVKLDQLLLILPSIVFRNIHLILSIAKMFSEGYKGLMSILFSRMGTILLLL